MASKTKALQDNANRIFNKLYTLKSNEDVYTLPRIDTMYSTEPFEIAALMAMKDELNKTKNLLNDKDIEEWRKHTSKMNPSGNVVRNLREQVNPEMCTQAWAKFYEIVSSCNVIPENCIKKKQVRSFHLCEAPGAFIASLNHYIKCKFDEIQWEWLASTLNPFYEGNDTKRMIEGEKFILETEAHWKFGENFDGDIMNWGNLKHLQRTVDDWGKADIVTADGSIDCADEPEKQETAIGQLLYCEVVAALTLLAPGGSLIVKMFTMFEHNTVCLLYLLACFFTEIKIIKPGTSKAGNSEVYCVCTSFAGAQHIPSELLETFHLHYTSQPPVNAMFPQNSLPAQFLESIVNCAKTFSAHQRNAITRNIERFENSSKGQRKFLFNLRQYIAEEYIRRYDVTILEQSLFVVSRIRLNGSQLYCWPEAAKDVWHHSGHHTGCYQERMQMTKLSWRDRVVFPRDGLNTFKSAEELVQDIIYAKPVHWLPGPSVPVSKSNVVNWTVQLGKPITKIESSRFCPSSLIDELNEARLNATVLRTQEGQRLMEKLEHLAHEKLRVASGMTSVLRNSNLLGGQTNSNFVDISGDCRFICGLVDSAGCTPAQCCGLFCRNCASPPEALDKFDGVVYASSCLSSKVDVAGRVKSLVGRTDDEGHVVCGSVFSRCKSSDGSRCKSSDGSRDELSSRPTLVNQCLMALRVLEKRDSFVCEISDTLTQFTVGVIYILHQLFQQVSLCPAVGRLSSSPTQFLVCQSYSPSTNSLVLTDYMAKIFEDLDRRPSGKDLITLVPISKLFSEEFYQYLRTHTTNRVRTQLDCIVNLERLLLT